MWCAALGHAIDFIDLGARKSDPRIRSGTRNISAPIWKVFEVRRRLAAARRREETVVADPIGLVPDRDHPIVLRADVLVPLRVTFATIAPLHGPGPGQGIVDRRDFVIHHRWVGLVEIDALFDDR